MKTKIKNLLSTHEAVHKPAAWKCNTGDLMAMSEMDYCYIGFD